MSSVSTFAGRALLVAAATLLTLRAAVADPALVVSDLNMRAGPGTDTPVIYTIPGGSTVDVLSCGGNWCQVALAGRVGYANRQYLDFGGDPAPGGQTYAPPPGVYEDGEPVYGDGVFPPVSRPRPYYGPGYYAPDPYGRNYRRPYQEALPPPGLGSPSYQQPPRGSYQRPPGPPQGRPGGGGAPQGAPSQSYSAPPGGGGGGAPAPRPAAPQRPQPPSGAYNAPPAAAPPAAAPPAAAPAPAAPPAGGGGAYTR